MIIINAVIETNPGAVAAMRDAVAVMEKASRAEPGCIGYAFATDINNPTNLRVVEHWTDMDSLKAHMAMPHMAAFGEAMRKNPPKRVDVKMFDATELPFPPR
jgi:quinol monooxygenase YgiN